jgi:hypothetical protein
MNGFAEKLVFRVGRGFIPGITVVILVALAGCGKCRF